MEADPGIEFELYVAEKLGRTVAELRHTMSTREWLYWIVYYGRKAQRIELNNK